MYKFMELKAGEARDMIGKRKHIAGFYLYIAAPIQDTWAQDSAVCQTGQCRQCHTSLTSWAKDVTCPKCEAVCYLT